MRTNQKDKRTKEDILKLLDRALENEERLATKIQTLEANLAECEKKAADPGYELTDKALPASKVSFRIDYYRTAAKGPLKGVIQHLFSQEKRSFEGKGIETIADFMGKYAPADKKAPAPAPTSATPAAKPTPKKPVPVVAKKTPPTNPTPTPQQKAKAPQTTPLPAKKTNPAPAAIPAMGGSRLLHRLKSAMDGEQTKAAPLPEQPAAAIQTIPEKQAISPRLQRILSHIAATEAQPEKRRKPENAPVIAPVGHTPLLARLRTAYLDSVAENG